MTAAGILAQNDERDYVQSQLNPTHPSPAKMDKAASLVGSRIFASLPDDDVYWPIENEHCLDGMMIFGLGVDAAIIHSNVREINTTLHDHRLCLGRVILSTS